jgi:hypothetical protein
MLSSGLSGGGAMVVKAAMVFTVAVMQRVDLNMGMLIYLVNLAVAVTMTVHLQRLAVV